MQSPVYGILEFKDIANKEQLGIFTVPVISCITSAFGNVMPDNEVDGALKGSHLFIALTPNNEVLAFASLNQKNIGEYTYKRLDYSDETPRLSLGGATVQREYQGYGIYSTLNQYRLAYLVREKIPVLTTTTQNPKVERGIENTLEYYKRYGLKEFRLERVPLPGFYKRRLTNYTLKVKDTPYENLDYAAGDGYSLVFHIKYE